jgi:hypothetical protein
MFGCAKCQPSRENIEGIMVLGTTKGKERKEKKHQAEDAAQPKMISIPKKRMPSPWAPGDNPTF